jgi:CheY-like chemotaxis protein
MTKILLVEDDKSLREIYGVRLLAEGYDIVSAGDGEEALAMAIKEKPTLIISDVMMPKISGFDMLDILRSTTETRDIKVIMMTALSSDDQRNRGEQLGADKYLVKSQVGIEDVVRTVHEVLEDGNTPAPAPTPAEPIQTSVATEPTQTPTPSGDAVVQTDGLSAVSPADPSGSSAPGNDEAGPLPPQPDQSSLPQPTAPFTSPRPTNLGERVVQPVSSDNSEDEPSVTAEEIARELQASADPINSQVDDPSNDTSGDTETTSVTPVGAPYIPQAPSASFSADTPSDQSQPPAQNDLSQFGALAPADTPTTPAQADPLASANPQQPVSDPLATQTSPTEPVAPPQQQQQQ